MQYPIEFYEQEQRYLMPAEIEKTQQQENMEQREKSLEMAKNSLQECIDELVGIDCSLAKELESFISVIDDLKGE